MKVWIVLEMDEDKETQVFGVYKKESRAKNMMQEMNKINNNNSYSYQGSEVIE